MVAGVLALLCVGGSAVGYVLYDRATAPDRSSPTLVVDSYLRAVLTENDDTLADLFRCPDSLGKLADLTILRNDLEARERQFNTQIDVKWGQLQVQKQGDVAEVQVDLIISAYADGVSQTDRQPWRFVTRLMDGWRVCAGAPVK